MLNYRADPWWGSVADVASQPGTDGELWIDAATIGMISRPLIIHRQ